MLVALVVQAGATGSAQVKPPPAPADPPQRSAVFNLKADQEDAVALLRRLAAEARVSIAFVGVSSRAVTIALHDASFDQAVALIAGAAALSAAKVEGAYVIGPDPERTADSAERANAIYRVQHVRAERLVQTLKEAYPSEQLRVILGPDEYSSPSLKPLTSSSSTSAASGDGDYDVSSSQPPAAAEGSSPAAATPASPGARAILLIGDAAMVKNALALCRTMDHRRRQVRISAKITDIDVDAIRQFGIKWTEPKPIALKEQLGGSSTADPTPTTQRPVFSIGKFLRDPFFLEVAIAALEQEGRSKLLATPSLSILDGDRGYILIGDRHLYPKLTSITSASTPIFDTSEVSVGIRLDVAVEMTDSNEMILTLYPQVSAITGFLQTGFGAYPQIATREQQTTIRARAGETIVIGGLLKDGEISQLRGVPGLSKIPILGELFKYRNKQRVKTELVIMITPEIIDDTPALGEGPAGSPKG